MSSLFGGAGSDCIPSGPPASIRPGQPPAYAGSGWQGTAHSQFGQALQRLGIEMIPLPLRRRLADARADVPHPSDRLPRELALAGITDMVAANRYLTETYRPAFTPNSCNRRWKRAAPLSPGRQPLEGHLVRAPNAKSVLIIA